MTNSSKGRNRDDKPKSSKTFKEKSDSYSPKPRRSSSFDDKKAGARPRSADKPSGGFSKDSTYSRNNRNDERPAFRNNADERNPRNTPRNDSRRSAQSFDRKDSKPRSDERFSKFDKRDGKPRSEERFNKFDRKDSKPHSESRFSKFDKRDNERSNERFNKFDKNKGQFDKRGSDFKPSNDSRPFRKRDNNSEKFGKTERVAPINRSRQKQEVNDDLIRLNRYISNAGICSRRKADELIESGVISVNGQVVSELGHRIDPYKDEVRFNGELLKREKKVYVILNKPKDYITTTDDPQERRTVMQLVAKASKERIYPVGRLDRNTTGLLLLTNDGELADKLSHPRNGISKMYHVELNKNLAQGDFNQIQFGLELEDGLIKPDNISYVAGASKKEIGIQIHSGKNRIVRRIFEHLGYDVVKLDRVVYGNLTKKDLPRGRWRYLEDHELIQLKHLI
jgi:23S rRNA pseudouridine2605 synthase